MGTDLTEDELEKNEIFEGLVKNRYIDKNGVIQPKFLELKGHSAMTVAAGYEDKKQAIYDIVYKYRDHQPKEEDILDYFRSIFSYMSNVPIMMKKPAY